VHICPDPTSGLLRLILEDQTNYYLLEIKPNGVRPLAIRKELVDAIGFSRGAVAAPPVHQ
jgi:hypothetical protein